MQVLQTLEQIDFVRQLTVRYPETFEMAITAADIRRIHKAGRIACMMGVEGGGQIDERFSVLRAYRRLGASYLTLTQAKTISWADSATDNPTHGGLTPFGVAVVHELNRLGMLVDISHVSEGTMRAAIAASAAPVIFSHSDARALSDHTRNVSDSVLRLVARNGGVVMVSFAPNYVSDEYRHWNAERAAEITRNNNPPFGGLYVGEPDRAAAALSAWDKDHPRPSVTVKQVADHIEHIVQIAGIDHVGIGSDLDGINSYIPEGLDSVEDYPALLAELIRRGWTDSDIAKLAGENVLRVMAEVEQVAIKKKMEPPAVATVAQLDGENGK
jgi:membrane dipeptidase